MTSHNRSLNPCILLEFYCQTNHNNCAISWIAIAFGIYCDDRQKRAVLWRSRNVPINASASKTSGSIFIGLGSANVVALFSEARDRSASKRMAHLGIGCRSKAGFIKTIIELTDKFHSSRDGRVATDLKARTKCTSGVICKIMSTLAVFGPNGSDCIALQVPVE